MPPRKKPQQLDLVEHIDQLPPAIGHNSQAVPGEAQRSGETDDELIAENHKLEDQIKGGLAKFNEWAKPRKERIEAIESEIRRRLLERGADSTRTDSGTAYFSDIMNVKIEDREALFDFICDSWDSYGNDMLKLGAAVGAVRTYMDANEGKVPPGLSISFFRRLNINRS